MKKVYYNVDRYGGHHGNKSFYHTMCQFTKKNDAEQYAKQSKSCQENGYKITKVLI